MRQNLLYAEFESVEYLDAQNTNMDVSRVI